MIFLEKSERVLDFFENKKTIGLLKRGPERESLKELVEICVEFLALFIITSLDGTDNFYPRIFEKKEFRS